MEPVFVLVSYDRFHAHANSGGYTGKEVTEQELKQGWSLREAGDADLLNFLKTAKVGEYTTARGGGAFIFRTR